MSASTTVNPSQSAEPQTPRDITSDTTLDATGAANAASGKRRRTIRIAAILGLVIVGVIVWRVFFTKPALPDSVVAVSGRIEGDDSAVASKTTGRILEVRVREGDVVNAGDTIAILDDEQVRARENQARASLLEAQAKAKGAQEQIAVLQEQLQQSQLQVGQSKLDTEGHIRQAEAELATAQ